ncbi:MAG: HAMP domain-containing sensor histidine kinase [Pseudomonadota bacterium]
MKRYYLIYSILFLAQISFAQNQNSQKSESNLPLTSEELIDKVNDFHKTFTCDSVVYYAERYLATSPPEDTLLLPILRKCIACQNKLKQYEAALNSCEYLEQVLQKMPEQSWSYFVLHREKASTYVYLDSIYKAIEQLEYALAYANDPYQESLIHNLFTYIYYNTFNDLEKALVYARKEFEYESEEFQNNPSPNDGDIVNFFNAINVVGVIYEDLGVLDSTLYYFDQLLELSVKYPDAFTKDHFCLLHGNRSSLFLKSGQLERALLEGQKAYSFIKQTRIPRAAISCLTTLIKIQLELKNFEQVKILAKQLETYEDILPDNKIKLDYHSTLSKAYKQIDITKANYNLEQTLVWKDSTYANQAETDLNLLEAEHQFNLERQEMKYQQALTDEQISAQRWYLVLTILLLLAAVSIGLILAYNRRKMRQLILQLQSSEGRLQRSNKRLSRFVHSVSHDIMNKLEYILLAGNTLVEDEVRPQKGLRSYYDESRETANWLKTYCRDLLDWSEKGLESTVEALTNTQAIVEEILTSYELELENRQFDLDIGELPKVSMDEMPLKQIFQNIIDNSIKHTRSIEHPKLKIAVTDQEHGFTILVKDNGVGLSSDEAKHIFEQQVNLSLDHGRGLTYVQDLLEEQGEKIWATPNEWGGASFYFTLSS